MEKYGLDKNKVNVSDNQTTGRIISGNRDNYKAITQSGEITAEISDSFKYKINSMSDYPVVGDFVLIESKKGFYYINEILSRKNQLVKKGAWDANYDCPIAANIDTVFILTDSDTENLKAYMSISSNINAETIILFNRDNSISEKELDNIMDITKGLKVIISSDISKEKNKILSLIHEGQTVVFLGPEHYKAKIVSEMFDSINLENPLTLLPNEAVLINTPEMRELGIEGFNITKKFADIR